MAQHDYILENQSGPSFRADLNGAMQAIATNNSGSTEPSPTYAYQFWADTTAGLWKQRNGANSAWITIGTLGATNFGLAPLASPAFTGTPTAPTASAGTNTTQLATTAFVTTAAGLSVPAGSVITYAGNSAPAGWLKCNGAAISRSTYSALFAVVGSTYGAGNGTSTFNVPDLRGEFVRGWDDARGVDATRAIGTAQGESYLSHAHGISDPGHTHGAADAGHAHTYTTSNTNNQAAAGGSAAQSNSGTFGTATGTGYASITVYGAATGITGTAAAGGAETRPRNVALLYCIKT
jgi:microcystin-dependent protein